MTRLIVIDSEPRRERAIMIVTRIPLPPVWQVSIEEYHPKRSQQQGKRYWLICKAVGDHVGYDKDTVHDFFKQKFLGTRVVEIAGERATLAPSSRFLKVGEFNEYMRLCEDWSIAELGVWLE